MTGFIHLLHNTAIGADVTAVLYASTVTVVALTSVVARTGERRHDARETLKLLLGRRLRH